MRTILRRSWPVAPLVVALLGCDGTSPSEPVLAPEPPAQAWQTPYGTLDLVRSAGITLLDFRNSEVIGPAGGTLYLGLHQLVVPRGAVKNPTRFTMIQQWGHNVIVDLEAVDLKTNQEVTQFPRELQIKLSYLLMLVPRHQAHRLVIVWVKDDGGLVPLRTTVQPNSYHAIGWTDHFSKFAMGMN